MEPINIVTLKWGVKYNAAYVNKLYAGVVRNTTIPFTFHCFTEKDDGLHPEIEVHPLPFANNGGMQGWWQKVWLFSNDIPIRGKIFYIDLDTLITGNIDDLMQVSGFVVLRDFFAEKAKGVSVTDIGSGLMLWDTTGGQPYPEIWERFIKNPQQNSRALHPHGDQRWIQRFVPKRKYWQDVFPGRVVSFKTHCVGGLPVGACVVCYHGKPSIPESINRPSRGWRGVRINASPWVKGYWHE